MGGGGGGVIDDRRDPRDIKIDLRATSVCVAMNLFQVVNRENTEVSFFLFHDFLLSLSVFFLSVQHTNKKCNPRHPHHHHLLQLLKPTVYINHGVQLEIKQFFTVHINNDSICNDRIESKRRERLTL